MFNASFIVDKDISMYEEHILEAWEEYKRQLNVPVVDIQEHMVMASGFTNKNMLNMVKIESFKKQAELSLQIKVPYMEELSEQFIDACKHILSFAARNIMRSNGNRLMMVAPVYYSNMHTTQIHKDDIPIKSMLNTVLATLIVSKYKDHIMVHELKNDCNIENYKIINKKDGSIHILHKKEVG